MKHYIALILGVISFVSLGWSSPNLTLGEPVISSEELKLYDLIMAYRASNGLPKIPLSKSLTHVAQVHCRDLAINKADLGNGCNAHSWSNKGEWSACCYTPDHKEANCMWDKPRELSTYEGNGFEIACGSSDPIYKGYVMTADYAFYVWQNSYHHNNIILDKDVWEGKKWNAIGIGIYEGFACVWFGELVDKEGAPSR